MADWNPALYLTFADERARPARDLLQQVPVKQPRLVYDLGCGPGNSTALIYRAFPEAEVIGVDASPAMLVEARAAQPHLEFIQADITDLRAPATADLIFSNAAFQWLPDHAGQMLRLLRQLRTGAALAVQMPDNMAEPSHRMMHETALYGSWASLLHNASEFRQALLGPGQYYEMLKPYCARLDIWRTTYMHAVNGIQGIVDMFSSTGLRPWLDPLNAAEKQAFLIDYTVRLAKHYPVQRDGKVLLAFPRLFIVAQR
jgi:trans-aconitate 2-methyltransferase